MRTIRLLAICAMLFPGCSSPESAHQPPETDRAVADLNRQIEKFNAERPEDMGIVPIAQRVWRVEFEQAKGTVNCYDGGRRIFLILNRERGGQFKGVLRVPFHELPKPEGHSWGEAVAEFTLPADVFNKRIEP